MHDLPLNEITLRKYEEPYELSKRELVKKICLSLGLLQPGDSRDIIVDIFLVLIEAKKQKQKLNLEEIKKRVIEKRKKFNLDINGTADSNIRRQLKRLRNLFFVEKIKNNYGISEFQNLKAIFEEKIENFYLKNINERIKQYLKELEREL